MAYHIDGDLENVIAAGSLYIIRIKKDKLLPQYLAWWLNQPPAQHYFDTWAHKGGISYVSKDMIYRLKIKVPLLDVQRKVANIEALRKREQVLLEKLARLRLQLVKATCLKAIRKRR